MLLWTNVHCHLATVSQEKKWRNIRSFQFQSFLTTIISTVFLTNWMTTLLVIIKFSEIRYFRVDRFQTIHKSENDVAFTLSPEQEARLITDEQVRYQAFSMLSGNEWARITFEYKGLYRDVLESDIPKLKLLEESTSEGVDQVRYEIETF